MKKILLAFGLIIVFVGLIYGSIHLFGWHIFNTQSCQSFNIDNIELRTGVNIPKVTSTECRCENNTKVSRFIIDTETVDLDRYVDRNDFKLINDLYIKENDNKYSTYKVTFNKKTAELLVNLTYKNN